MRNLIFLLIIIFICKNSFSDNLFSSTFYDVNFQSDNVDSDKLKKISKIKNLSIKKIFKSILIEEDFKIFEKNLDEDLINTLIKNIIIEDEKIINSNYFARIKINFDKERIVNYLRKKKLRYVEFYPNKILTIIYENDSLSKNLFSITNSYYNYLNLNSDNFPFFQIPNLDINDRYIISHKDLENLNVSKIKKFNKKYSSENSIIIFSNNNLNKKYSIFLFTNNKIIEVSEFSLNNNALESFFKKIQKLIINEWKKQNFIQNEFINEIECKIKYYNLKELRLIKNILDDISIIQNLKLKKISYKENNYLITYYGDKKYLEKLFLINNISINSFNNECKLNLKWQNKIYLNLNLIM